MSGNGFRLLRLRPELGRLLNAADDISGGNSAEFSVVISDRFWRGHFGGSATALNRKLVINGIPVTVVGVMPPAFNGMLIGSSPDVVLPLEFEVRSSGRYSQRHFAGATWLSVFGRRRRGLSFSETAARIEGLAPAVFRESLATLPAPVQKELLPRLKLRVHAGQTGGADQVSRERGDLRDLYKRPLLAAQGLACFLLLLCVVNLVVLQFARSKSREKEFAIRASLGASRLRIWEQTLIESTLVGALGAPMALLFGYVLDWALSRFLQNQQEYWLVGATSLGSGVGLMVLVAAVGSMMFSALIPEVFRTWSDLARLLKSGRGGTLSFSASGRIERSLIPLQVSVCTVLLVAAGLFLSSVSRLLSVPMGFNPKGVLELPFNEDASAIDRQKRTELSVLDRLRSTHSVSVATLLEVQPIGGGLPTTAIQSKEGSRRIDRQAAINGVGPDYLAVMGTRLMQGREFRATDIGSPPVCMVSISAAHYFFAGVSAIGKRLMLLPPRSPSTPAECEVVGVTEDTKYNDLRAVSPRLIYLNAAQSAFPVSYIAVRTSNISDTVQEFSRIMHQEAPKSRVTRPRLLTDQIAGTIGLERLLSAASSLFGILSVLVTSVGLYGFLTWSVVRRTSEIAIRMALGAESRQVAWMISRETLLLLGIGVAAGGVTALLLTTLITKMLYSTTPANAMVFCIALLAMLILGVAATWAPAKRASQIGPALALRCE